MIQMPPIANGSVIMARRASVPWKKIAASTMVATVVTAKVSNRSAAMPAQSPTLSPTLSAIVAGLRGSSSGIPASTLPTRSPPTSAPLVKMPPPRRAKIEISDAPKPSATIASITVRSLGPLCIVPVVHRAGEEAEIGRHPEQCETGDQHAGDRTRFERELEAAGKRFGRGLRDAHVGAHRNIHADEAGRTRQDRADSEADCDQPA